MGELDPIRPPERSGFFVTLTVAAAVVLALIMFMSWWLKAPMPRAFIVIAIAAGVGWLAGKTFFRRKK